MTTFAIISDIHGCLPALEQCLAQLEPLKLDYYLLIGDLLNHGPRNPVPDGYAPAVVADRLNQLRERVIAVRGNCDSEVDQMLLQFPCLAPYNYLVVDGRRFCLTHGHLYAQEQLALRSGDVLISGHTHLAGFSEPAPGILALNPGSLTFPRNGTKASYATYRPGLFSLHALEEGGVLETRSLL